MQMIKVIYGEKGTGKTKVLIDAANSFAAPGAGDVVFIDDSNQLMYDLKREIRFTNVSDYPISGIQGFLGFICGIVSQDYDLNGIFIDGLTYILKQKVDDLEPFFKSIKEISEKNNIDFFISINGKPESIPEYIKAYIL